jgi:hypothetical protein
MPTHIPKLNPHWIRQPRQYFREFLEVTQFPEPVRTGTRGSAFTYPEWLIMLIAVLAVKGKQKSYQAIHRMVLPYWEILSEGRELTKPISESQVRDRLKKSAISLEELQRSFFRFFLKKASLKKVSADKMRVKAKGPVGRKKEKEKGEIPPGLRGRDREATWGKSASEGWVYGHGSFCLTWHEVPVVGVFQWNSGHEAKRMESEVVFYAGLVRKVYMDSKADDCRLSFRLKRERGIPLIAPPRKGKDKSPLRRAMIRAMWAPRNRQEYKHRSVTVEPMQGLVAEIFELGRCWIRGASNNRWLFGAMGVAVQQARWRAYLERRSTWEVKAQVLGI